MSSPLVSSSVGLNDAAVGLPPAFYHQREENSKMSGAVEKDVDAAALARKRSVFSCLEEEEAEEEEAAAAAVAADADESSESSSIGVASSLSEEEEEGEEEVESKKKEGAFGSLVSLDDSLPIKRGLSNFFSGKSKSFANLSDVASACDLAKPENPFNKKRRILMAFKARSASYGSLASASTATSSSASMSTLLSPAHAVAEDGDEEAEAEAEAEEEDGRLGDGEARPVISLVGHDGSTGGEMKPMSSFRSSSRSFYLSDLRRCK